MMDPNQNIEKDYDGIFYFRFWQYGEMAVDDFIPVMDNGVLHCLLWGMLWAKERFGPGKEALEGVDKNLYDEFVRDLIVVC